MNVLEDRLIAVLGRLGKRITELERRLAELELQLRILQNSEK